MLRIPNPAVLESTCKSLPLRSPCVHCECGVDYSRNFVLNSLLSLSSGSKRQEIVPVAPADNGLRWHVRACDGDRRRFSDFVLTRITKASELDEPVTEHEMMGADEQWARIVHREFAPHLGIAWPKAVKSNYGVTIGVLKIKTRAALAGYGLRRWLIDSTTDHHLDPASHQLWLRNPQTLYGVESAALAPGDAGTDRQVVA